MKFPTYHIMFLFLLIAQSVLGQHGLSTERLQRYDQFINNEVANGNIAGAVSIVVRKGEVAHYKSFGKENIQADQPMTKEHLFFIQSMTKPIISVAIMMLYEEGHFFLDDPVHQYIPEFKNLKVSLDPEVGLDAGSEALKTPVTIRQLLCHTAGFSHGLGKSKLDEAYEKAMYYENHQTIQDRVYRMLELPLVSQPGSQWIYGASADVLSVLIEEFSGQTTDEFLKKRIFEPLGMMDTGYNLKDTQLSRVATVHEFDENGVLKPKKNQPTNQGNTIWSGSYGLFSTAGDYMKFCRMLLNNGKWNGKRLLSRKTVELMTVNHVGGLYGDQGFGLGFAIITNLAESQELGSEGRYYWGGYFRTHFFIDPKEQLIAIIMIQIDPYSDYYKKKMQQFIYQAIED